jgi:pimeloyl-ACP methyl ester carboxylesterase
MDLRHRRLGAGPTLVLIHGLGSQWQMWRPVLDRLAAERDVIALDLPGFGESPPLEGAQTVERLADAVVAFLRAQGVERPHVAGNSLGGGIALALGASGRALSVCGLSPIGFSAAREPAYQKALLLATRATARALAPYADRVMASAAGRTFAMAHMTARPWRVPPAEAAGAARNMAASPGFGATLPHGLRWRAVVPDCPTTIAWGQRDRLLVYARQAPRARRRLPQARHVTLRGCGHLPTWDDPGQVAEVILAASAG